MGLDGGLPGLDGGFELRLGNIAANNKQSLYRLYNDHE